MPEYRRADSLPKRTRISTFRAILGSRKTSRLDDSDGSGWYGHDAAGSGTRGQTTRGRGDTRTSARFAQELRGR